MHATPLHPVKRESRIWIMDALRGFAILGIFIANLGSGFAFYDGQAQNVGPYFTSWDHQMIKLHHFLIEGKFYSIFSFLFGWGIAIQLQRSSEKEIASTGLVKRRLLFMFLLGLTHLLLWTGDIVTFYSLVAFLLLWMRNWKEKNLFITAIVLLLSPILLYTIKVQWPVTNTPSNLLFGAGQLIGGPISGVYSEEDYLRVMKNLSFWDYIKLNVSGIFFRFGDLVFQSRISKVLGMFILGYLIGKNLRYKSILANKKLLWSIVITGLFLGLPASYILVQYMENQSDYYQLTTNGIYRTIAYTFSVPVLALAYISLFFLLATSAAGSRILKLLTPVGKMAFSNYILHSIIGVVVFQSFALNYIGKVGPVYYTLFAFIVFFTQIIVSTLWLRHFEFGPVEWLWRSFTYGTRQPFKKTKNLPGSA
jgi:uncharacterized protein